MTQVAFDTLKFVRTLEKSGVSSEWAEAISTAVQESQESAELATKRDIDDLRKDIEKLELRMTIKLGLMMMAAVGLMATLVKLL